MVGCDRTAQILGLACLVVALPLIVFTNKAAWGVCNIGEPEARHNTEERCMEAAGPGARARDAGGEPKDAGCDRRSLFSWLCLIPVGGLLAPGLYFTFFCS